MGWANNLAQLSQWFNTLSMSIQPALTYGALAAVLIASMASEAQTISGSGTRDCSALNFAIDQDSDVALDSYLSWVQGYISGFNATNHRNIDIAIDHAGLFHWLANYCRANPRTPLHQAVREMIGIHAR